MGFNSVADIRGAWGKDWADASDEEVLRAYSGAAKMDPVQAANLLGYDPGKGSLTRERASASVDSYQSNLYGVGEAVSGKLGLQGVQQWMRSGRQDNEFQAEVAQGRSKALGGIDSYKDVSGVGSALNYAGGLVVQSLPYMAEMLVPGAAVRMGSGVLMKAIHAGRAADVGTDLYRAGQVAEKTLEARQMAAGAVASYPSAVGDILGNQREQLRASGQDDSQVNLGSALAGGVPYVLLNSGLGVGKALNQVGLAKPGIRALDGLMDGAQGVKGGLIRTGATVGKVGLEEGASETAQEFINQYAGRMAVDPNETFFNDASIDRFKESFVGGATLGGAFGAVGGHRRSEGYKPPDAPSAAPLADTAGKVDLLQHVPLEGVLDSYGPSDGPSAAQSPEYMPRGLAVPQAENQYDLFNPNGTPTYGADSGSPMLDVAQTREQLNAPSTPPQQVIDQNLGIGRQGYAGKGYPQQFAAAANEPTGNMVSSADNGQLEHPETSFEAQQRQLENQQRVQNIRDIAAKKAEEVKALDARVASLGLKGNAVTEVFAQLEAEHADGAINDVQFAENIGLLQAGKAAQVRRHLKGMAESQAALAEHQAALVAQPIQALKDKEAARVAALVAPPVPKAIAGINPDKRVVVGRSDRQKSVSPMELYQKIAESPPTIKMRMLLAMGYTMDVNPDTGAPMLLATDKPRTFEQVAAAESLLTGKVVTKQAVAQSLQARGITEDVVNRTVGNAAPESVSDAELEMTPAEGEGAASAAGMRVENSAAKAFGAGMVEGGNSTKAQRAAGKHADILLRADQDQRKHAAADGELDMTDAVVEQSPDVVAAQARANQDIIDANARETMQSPEASQARADWNENDVAFDDLPVRMQAEWVDEYREVAAEFGTNFPQEAWDKLTDIQRSIERDYHGHIDRQAAQFANPRIAGKPGASAKGESRPRLDAPRPVGPDNAPGVENEAGRPALPATQGPDQSRSQAVAPSANDLKAAKAAKAAKAQWNDTYGDAIVPWDNLEPADQRQVVAEYGADGLTDTTLEQLQDTYAVRFSPAAQGAPDGHGVALTKQDFKDGAEAAKWLAHNAKHPFIRLVMAKIGPFLAGVNLRFVNEGDMVPAAVANQLMNAQGLNRFEYAAGTNTVYIRTDIGAFEETLAHELVHAATVSAVVKGSKVFDTLAQQVRYALSSSPEKGRTLSPAEKEAHAFFAERFRDPKEFVAYAMTSPTFQNIMQRMGADGRWFSDYRSQADEARITRPQPNRVGVPGVPKYSMWQKFADAVMGLFNVPKAYKAKYESLLRARTVALENNTASAKVELVPLSEALSRLMDEFVADKTNTPGPVSGVGPAGSPGVGPGGVTTPALSQITLPKTGNRVIDAMPGAAVEFWDRIKDGANWVAVRSVLTNDLIAMASKVLKSAKPYMGAMNRIQVERTKSERDVSDVLSAFRALKPQEQGTGAGTVNDFLKTSTMTKSWGFEPDWLPKGSVTVDTVQGAKFGALSPEGQAVAIQVFKHGHHSLQEMQTAVVDNINSDFDAVIGQLKAEGDTAAVKLQEAKKAKSLTDFKSLMDMRSAWPYSPLRRFGNHVVLAASAAYVKAKAAGDTKLMREMESDGDHYMVQFAETRTQARAIARKLQSHYPGGDVAALERLSQADGMMGGRDMLGALKRLRTMAADEQGLGEPTNARVDDLMRQLYLQLLSETSARKGEINRRNIAGADGDMMRSFATNGRATAHFIASLKTNGAVEDSLAAMKSEVSATISGREERQRYFNEIMRRHSLNLEYHPTPGVDKALAVSSTYLLLTNPSYYLMNATQPFTMSHPMMAGRHGYMRTAKELVKSYEGMVAVMRDGKLDSEDYAKLPADVRGAVKALAERGIISIEMEQELGKFESQSEGSMQHVGTALQKLRNVAQGVETVNRVSTAITAYRLEKQRGSTEAQALDYAAKVITDTHGDYTGFNAPRFMRSGVGRLTTQFRKFQLIQLSMFARLIREAYKGDTQEVKVAARWALAFNLAHLGVVGGASSLPGFILASTLLTAAFGDPDEPDDERAKLTRAVGKEWADLLWGGASQSLGLPLGGRIGAGSMASLMPFTDLEVSRKGYEKALVAAAGPMLGGLMPKMAEGFHQISQGDLWKGAEMLVPAGVANVSKAVRQANLGVTNSRGEVKLPADDINTFDTLLQAIGLPSSKLQDQSFRTSAEFNARQHGSARTTELKRDFARAREAGDSDGMSQARESWMKMQAARVNSGLKRQPISELTALRKPDRSMDAFNAQLQ